LRGKNEPSGMRVSSSLRRGPGARPFAALRVRVRVFSTFLSFFAGTVPLLLLGTRPNSSRRSVLCLCALKGEEVVRARENRLGMDGGQKQKQKARLTTVVRWPCLDRMTKPSLDRQSSLPVDCPSVPSMRRCTSSFTPSLFPLDVIYLIILCRQTPDTPCVAPRRKGMAGDTATGRGGVVYSPITAILMQSRTATKYKWIHCPYQS
jgi:hypothetical protein